MTLRCSIAPGIGEYRLDGWTVTSRAAFKTRGDRFACNAGKQLILTARTHQGRTPMTCVDK